MKCGLDLAVAFCEPRKKITNQNEPMTGSSTHRNWRCLCGLQARPALAWSPMLSFISGSLWDHTCTLCLWKMRGSLLHGDWLDSGLQANKKLETSGCSPPTNHLPSQIISFSQPVGFVREYANPILDHHFPLPYWGPPDKDVFLASDLPRSSPTLGGRGWWWRNLRGAQQQWLQPKGILGSMTCRRLASQPQLLKPPMPT